MDKDELTEILRPIIEGIRDRHEKGTKDYATADITLMYQDLHKATSFLCDPTFTFNLDEDSCVTLDHELHVILETLNQMITKYKKEND